MQLIDAAMARSRTVILGLVTVLIAGVITYVTIPKEAEPDIEIPIIYVYIEHAGISPEDAERLLVRPMEQEIRSIEGIKEMVAEAFEGGASLREEVLPQCDRAIHRSGGDGLCAGVVARMVGGVKESGNSRDAPR